MRQIWCMSVTLNIWFLRGHMNTKKDYSWNYIFCCVRRVINTCLEFNKKIVHIFIKIKEIKLWKSTSYTIIIFFYCFGVGIQTSSLHLVHNIINLPYKLAFFFFRRAQLRFSTNTVKRKKKCIYKTKRYQI